MKVVRWEEDEPPSRSRLERALLKEGLDPWVVRERGGMRYDTHFHEHDEIRILVRGRMKFNLDGHQLVLGPGDRLEVPAGMPHAAEVVDGEGAEYLCASRERIRVEA